MLPINTLLQDRYRIIEHIGRGGMGAVYKAEDLRLNAIVALKQTLVDSEQLSKAFHREAQLLASMRHPTIPRVSDHFSDSYGQFLIMEYVPGDDLGSLLEHQERLFDLADVLHWADEILSALEYLHTHEPPIIHRDIKPQNLKLTEGNHVMLLDFGLAKGASTLAHAASSESIFGYTPHYAPIEQIHGTGTDQRSDLYALAATLYHLLTGYIPIDAASRASALINGEPDPLRPASEINRNIPPAVAVILHHAMAQRASERPGSAASMRAALAQADRETLGDGTIDLERYQSAGGQFTEFATIGKSTTPLRRAFSGDGPARSPLRRWWGGVALLALLVVGTLAFLAVRAGAGSMSSATNATAISSVGTRGTPSAAAATRMSGSLNIAVAGFATPNQNQCSVTPEEALGLSTVMFRSLSDELQTAKSQVKSTADSKVDLNDIQLLPPEQTGTLTVTAAADQQQAVAQTALATNADVVLYGTITCENAPRQTHVLPAIYISNRKLQSFDQLQFIGEHPFGSPISSAGTANSAPIRDRLANDLPPRMRVLAQFLFGLDYYYAGIYQQSASAFQAASEVDTQGDPFIATMVALYQGTTAERLNDFVGARKFYERVLALDPNNISGQYSLADTLFYASRGDCQPDQQSPQGAKEDADGLRESLRRYKQIADQGAAIETNIRGVVALGMAQVYGCLSDAGIPAEDGIIDHRADAKQQFQAAIQFFDKDNAVTKDHLAEAHSGLGLLYVLPVLSQASAGNQDKEAVAATLRQAAREFCTASQLSGYANRQSEFHHRLAFIHGLLGEYDQAEIERTTAIQLDSDDQARYAPWHTQWQAAAKTTPSKAPAWVCQKDAAP